MLEFKTTDIVELIDDEKLYFVVGVVHDSERLFVTDDSDNEVEVPFNKVINRWAHKEL